MTLRPTLGLLVASLVTLAGCAGEGSSDGSASGVDMNASLESDNQKASYGVGLNVGSQLAAAVDLLDRPALMRGMEDAMHGNDPVVADTVLERVLQDFSRQVAEAQNAERDREADENEAAGATYREENGAKQGVTTTASGVQYEVLRPGDGARPTIDDQVRVHYRGTLVDGTEFDASYGGEPAVFPVGNLIPGFTEALMLMPVGSHYRVVIPGERAYGLRGSPPVIGPNATLVFEIELLEIVDG